jgi:hypothetical protein
MKKYGEIKQIGKCGIEKCTHVEVCVVPKKAKKNPHPNPFIFFLLISYLPFFSFLDEPAKASPTKKLGLSFSVD